MEWFTAALAAFAVIVPVELPDKTFVATLVLATRYRADGLAGGRRPSACSAWWRLPRAGWSPSFPRGRCSSPRRRCSCSGRSSCLAGRVGPTSRRLRKSEVRSRITESRTGLRAFGASFLVLFAAEWGDLSQLFTAGWWPPGGPVAVFAGSWAALGRLRRAVVLGRVLLRGYG